MTYDFTGYAGVSVTVGQSYLLVQELYGYDTISAWPNSSHVLMQIFYDRVR